jgi:hypothetical protein
MVRISPYCVGDMKAGLSSACLDGSSEKRAIICPVGQSQNGNVRFILLEAWPIVELRTGQKRMSATTRRAPQG